MIFVLPRLHTFGSVPTDDESAWSPESGLAVVADLLALGLVHHVGRFEPILPGHAGQIELSLAPGFTVGPAPRSARLLDEIRPISVLEDNVLLTGEPGSGRELVARTIHLSSARRDQPFVATSCEGVAGSSSRSTSSVPRSRVAMARCVARHGC